MCVTESLTKSKLIVWNVIVYDEDMVHTVGVVSMSVVLSHQNPLHMLLLYPVAVATDYLGILSS